MGKATKLDLTKYGPDDLIEWPVRADEGRRCAFCDRKVTMASTAQEDIPELPEYFLIVEGWADIVQLCWAHASSRADRTGIRKFGAHLGYRGPAHKARAVEAVRELRGLQEVS